MLDHCVQGQVRQLVGTLEYGTWGFWHKLCIAVILKGELTPVTDRPVNDSLSVTWLDQEAILQTRVDLEQKEEVANQTRQTWSPPDPPHPFMMQLEGQGTCPCGRDCYD